MVLALINRFLTQLHAAWLVLNTLASRASALLLMILAAVWSAQHPLTLIAIKWLAPA